MANEEQLAILKQGVEIWNEWRKKNYQIGIDLEEADLRRADLRRANLEGVHLEGAHLNEARLRGANLRGANLRGANLREAYLGEANLEEAYLEEADLWKADLEEADLRKAYLGEANLTGAKLMGANLFQANLGYANLWAANLEGAHLNQASLRGADLRGANLLGADFEGANLEVANLKGANLSGTHLAGASFRGTNLQGANLEGADLREADLKEASLGEANLSRADLTRAKLDRAHLVGTDVNQAKISGSSVYGINVWDLKGEFEQEKDLVITLEGQPIITVDDVKVAQFVYLILNNEKIRDVINTLTSKSVLILGRFGPPERKAVLDELRNKLRQYNLLPIVFDFERPDDKDYTETVQTLAGLSLFVIVDVTNPKSTPLEMEATVKQFKIPYVPIIDLSADTTPFAMMVDFQKSFHWVLPTFGYHSKEELLENIDEAVINRALKKHNELRLQKAIEPEILTLEDLKKGKDKV